MIVCLCVYVQVCMHVYEEWMITDETSRQYEHSFQKTSVFTYLEEERREGSRERERERDKFFLPVAYFPNGCNGQFWAKPNPGTISVSWMSGVQSGWPPSTLLHALGRNWIRNGIAGTQIGIAI